MNPLIKKFALAFQSRLNNFDRSAESTPIYFENENFFPIFIIGAPRTGSTLLYQMLLKHTKLAYISNFMSLIPSRMIIIARHFLRYHNIKEIRKDQFGYIPGLFSPSEAGAIQRKWFEEKSSPTIIRRTIIALSQLFFSAFINKNLNNSLRLENIFSVLPESRFIFVKRDPLWTAHSILHTRKLLYDSMDEWWSVKPPGSENLSFESPEYQVFWQIKTLETIIEDFLSKFKPRHLVIQYENLCSNPEKCINEISDEFHLQKKISDFNKFKASASVRIPDDMWQRLKELYLNQ